MRVAWAAYFVACVVGAAACAPLGNAPASVLPVDVHAAPDAKSLDEHPCRYGAVDRCIAKCEREGGQACNAAGVLFEFGDREDPALASRYYGQSCDGNYGPGCNNLAWLYLRGRGVARDQPRAMALFLAAFDSSRIACFHGDASGCLLAGELLYEGRAVAPAPDEAVAFFRRACEGGETRGCSLAMESE